jgi:hypothetical protein
VACRQKARLTQLPGEADLATRVARRSRPRCRAIAEIVHSARISEAMAPFRDRLKLLHDIPGVGLGVSDGPRSGQPLLRGRG